MGVVSGTALDLVCARRLQDGDEDGAMRRALDRFPVPEVARRVMDRFFLPGGRAPGVPYRAKPMMGHRPSQDAVELLVVANFAEVWLAREGHDGVVGINYLDKIQAPLIPSLYGAMLAGVDVVTMGAGVPKSVPGVMRRLASGDRASVPLYVSRVSSDFRPTLDFDPRCIFGGEAPNLPCPKFLPIVASVVLAKTLMRGAQGCVDGFVVETPRAGGHNAPPRGWRRGDPATEPTYGPRDSVDFAALSALGLPFWLAGSYGHAGGLQQAREAGARGIQVGTLFAFCEESGLSRSLKRRVIDRAAEGTLRVFTDPVASPTGFPFKVVKLDATSADEDVFARRPRVCDLGYLREAFETPDGRVDWRCPGEPFRSWERKGGAREDAEGRKCLCNGLMANLGMPQLRSDGFQEPPLLTGGDDVERLSQFLGDGVTRYTAADVVAYLRGESSYVGSAC